MNVIIRGWVADAVCIGLVLPQIRFLAAIALCQTIILGVEARSRFRGWSGVCRSLFGQYVLSNRVNRKGAGKAAEVRMLEHGRPRYEWVAGMS